MTHRVILDCDPGTDDALAILLALASREIDMLAITVAGGNVGLARTVANAAALVALAGADVAVHAGADRGLHGAFVEAAHVHGADGLGGIGLPAGRAASREVAADAIRRILRAATAKVTLVGIAPATNLALALMTEPSLAQQVSQIVLMSGAWGEGNITASAEFNAYNDPEALSVLLHLGVRVVLAPLELTAQALVTPARIAALRAMGGGRCLAAACEILVRVPPAQRFEGRGEPLHDPCAVAWLVRPDLFRGRDVSVQVEMGSGAGRGRTVVDRWGRSGAALNVHLLETLDADGFFALLGERLARLG